MAHPISKSSFKQCAKGCATIDNIYKLINLQRLITHSSTCSSSNSKMLHNNCRESLIKKDNVKTLILCDWSPLSSKFFHFFL